MIMEKLMDMATIRNKFQAYVNSLHNNFSTIAKEIKTSRESAYEIAGWVKKDKREKDILIYRVTATDKYINNFSVLEIYSDDNLLLNFSKKEIKYISTLAILLNYKTQPKYRLAWESFRNQLDANTVHLIDRDNPGVIKTNIAALEENISIIDGLSSVEAFNIGKEIGIRERMNEELLIRNCE